MTNDDHAGPSIHRAVSAPMIARQLDGEDERNVEEKRGRTQEEGLRIKDQKEKTRTDRQTDQQEGEGQRVLGTDPADYPPDSPDYVNPHDSSARWYLIARTYALRQGANLGFGLQHLASPAPPAATSTLWLDSTLGDWQGRGVIKVDVWEPPTPSKRRPAVINFHGGGFVLGQGTDDARWAASLVDRLGAAVFSVNYRLAPAYPFPKAVEDCADAVLQITARADELRLDPARICLSGFSSGGNLALATWLVLEQPEKWSYRLSLPRSQKPRVAGLALFYPLLDWTVSRPHKRARCLRPDMTLPSGLTDLIDASYIYPPIPTDARVDLRLSPGLMSDALVDRLPPVHLCLCEWDMLLPEALTFAERLNSRGKPVVARVVAREKHAWDKPPPLQPKESVAAEYEEAVRTLSTCVERAEEGKDGGGEGEEEGADGRRPSRPFSQLVRSTTGV